MRLPILPAIALTGALVALVPAIDLAAGPSNRPRDIKVVVEFPPDETNNKIQSDGLGAYEDGVDGVNAYISASNNGALIFSTGGQNAPVRRLRFSFDDCVAPTGCSAPWPDLAPMPDLDERAGLLANALRGGAVPTGGLMAMAIGEELSAWIKFDIPLDSDPAFYNVCFDSRKVVGPCGAAPGGTSTDARIRRVASSEWTIWANGSGDRADVIRDSQTRKTRTFTTLGTYSMPFSFTVTCVDPAACQ
jgi:hypothetical protein